MYNHNMHYKNKGGGKGSILEHQKNFLSGRYDSTFTRTLWGYCGVLEGRFLRGRVLREVFSVDEILTGAKWVWVWGDLTNGRRVSIIEGERLRCGREKFCLTSLLEGLVSREKICRRRGCLWFGFEAWGRRKFVWRRRDDAWRWLGHRTNVGFLECPLVGI